MLNCKYKKNAGKLEWNIHWNFQGEVWVQLCLLALIDCSASSEGSFHTFMFVVSKKASFNSEE